MVFKNPLRRSIRTGRSALKLTDFIEHFLDKSVTRGCSDKFLKKRKMSLANKAKNIKIMITGRSVCCLNTPPRIKFIKIH